MVFVTKSESETESLGKSIAKNLTGNEVLALYGDLGSGKTSLTRGISDFFGMADMVSSPTFSIVNEYSRGDGTLKIYHFDMYRVKTFEDLESTGFFDYLGGGIIIIEWSENVENFLPENAIKIMFEKTSENSRKITIEGGEFD